MKLRQPNVVLKATILLIIALIPIPLKGKDAFVKLVKIKTADGIIISMWVEQKLLRLGQHIVIKYKVENGSNASIYLIRRASLDITTEEDTLRIGAPVSPPDAHGEYDYNFTKVGRNKSYQNQLTISKDQYIRDKRYEILPLHIEMGFAYVRDIKGLNRRLNTGEDPIAQQGLLFERAITLLLSGVRMEVKE